ncbi:hypothetical protein [Conservatibacter flavescens]|uniref:Uncharacterized protein n=1 Tax=Conservatibacter flavescens TaxID=28161 RepID=A0A2M8S0Y2_9PAST|nr:hypothetical protein [Conservatibacter flavescens]PJG84812.1 hypothetical protein CVP05_09755 [Conservatibacter flavescens]
MMKTTNSSPSLILTRPLFKADPIIQPFNLEAVLSDLEQLCMIILERVGNIQQYIIYPHRVFKQCAWHIKIIGDKANTYLLLNISGYYQFINDVNATRLSISVIDDIDAFWLTYALANKLSIVPVVPTEAFQECGI